jgi:hypothetical protein
MEEKTDESPVRAEQKLIAASTQWVGKIMGQIGCPNDGLLGKTSVARRNGTSRTFCWTNHRQQNLLPEIIS